MSSTIGNQTPFGAGLPTPPQTPTEGLLDDPSPMTNGATKKRPAVRKDGGVGRPAPHGNGTPLVSSKLRPTQRRELLDLMMQGASPLVACRKLNIPMAAFWTTLDQDDGFATQLQRVWDALSLNVVAALYQAAIKGNGSAQQFWLKHRPPPRWAVTAADADSTDELDTLSDAELLDRARTEAPDLAAQIAARLAATGC